MCVVIKFSTCWTADTFPLLLTIWMKNIKTQTY